MTDPGGPGRDDRGQDGSGPDQPNRDQPNRDRPNRDQPGGVGDPSASRTRRLRIDLLVGAAVLVGVLVVGKGLSGGNRDGARPSASAASTPPLVSRSALPTSPVALPRPGVSNPAACPRDVRCLTQEAGNALALQPVRDRFPKAGVIRFHTVLLRTDPWAGDLWYRELLLEVGGGQEIEIRISVRGRTAQEQRGRVGTQMFDVSALGPYIVRATVPQTVGLTADELHAIAADKRLLAP